MSFFSDKVLQSLQDIAPKIRQYEDDKQGDLSQARQLLDKATSLGHVEVMRRLNNRSDQGALLSAEWDNKRVVSFQPRFNNHAEARDWAYSHLLDRVTFCADGSQIMPDKSFSIPIAAVQVGWFTNYHRADGHYEKGARFEVLPPQALQSSEGVSEQAVSLRRFQLEIEATVEFIQKKLTPRPLVYVDGSLVLSFAQKLPEAAEYVQCMLSLLDEAEATETPIIGYIDSSYAHDLLDMLGALFGQQSDRLTDARLVEDVLKWGDRTPTSICAREGILDAYGRHRRKIGFTHLKTNEDLPPVRLEYPVWMEEKGLLPEVLDIVRAEAIVGNGYPYTIETADATAVLTGGDREAFYRLLQDFSHEQGLPIRISSKAKSKSRRRHS